MTVSYTAEVATCTRFGCFWKLLIRWRASIYKIIWADLLVFLVLFYAMAAFYRHILPPNGKIYGSLIPLSFVLGFYVSVVVERWWSQYITVPWPDPLAVYVSALVRGQDEHGRLMRRTIMRYVCLALTMVLTMISPVIKRRFPTIDYLVDAGLMNRNEATIIEAIEEKFPKHPKYWMPIVWAASIVTRARKEGRIWDDFSLKSLIDELNKFRAGCNMLIHYDTISVPLVYTQVVTLAVYTYFLGAIFGNQWTEKQSEKNFINYYFPLFSTLEFFFFMGWLKVAETLICPFGDDDDDFELNWVIDRNIKVCYLIVDEMHNEHPQLVRDQYWDEVFPNELPYQGEVPRAEHPESSTARLHYSKTLAKSKSVTSSVYQLSPTHSDENDFTDFDEDEGAFNVVPHDDSEMHIRFYRGYKPYLGTSESVTPNASLLNLSDELNTDELIIDNALEKDEINYDALTLGENKDEFDLLREERDRRRVERQLEQAALTAEILKAELGFKSEEQFMEVKTDDGQQEDQYDDDDDNEDNREKPKGLWSKVRLARLSQLAIMTEPSEASRASQASQASTTSARSSTRSSRSSSLLSRISRLSLSKDAQEEVLHDVADDDDNSEQAERWEEPRQSGSESFLDPKQSESSQKPKKK